jgi:hypothetical protein
MSLLARSTRTQHEDITVTNDTNNTTPQFRVTRPDYEGTSLPLASAGGGNERLKSSLQLEQ